MISTQIKLLAYLRLFKKRMVNQGLGQFQLYPAFCIHYDKNKEQFALPKETVLDAACQILIEED